MGATTKSFTGLFANTCGRACGRITREHFTTGNGTRSAATQGYLSLSLAYLTGLARTSRGDSISPARESWRDQVREQARWLLKRLGGLLASALPNLSGAMCPAQCPASSMPQPIVAKGQQAVGRPQNGVQRVRG
jgi:hypothetical protein